MQNSSIEYTKYFNVTQLDTIKSESIFYSIFKKFIITHFIILLKTYSQLINNKEYYLNSSGDTYSNIKKNDFIKGALKNNTFINIFYISISNKIKHSDKYKKFVTYLRNEISNSLDDDILKNVGKHIIDYFIYDNSINNNTIKNDDNTINHDTFISLLKILYVLLDYHKFKYITFEEFQPKIINYINSLYNSDLHIQSKENQEHENQETHEDHEDHEDHEIHENNVETSNNNTIQITPLPEDIKNISKYLFLHELINTYLESLTLYCYDENAIIPLNCIIYYVEFNDINKINHRTNQLISMFVFIPDRKKINTINTINTINNYVISKHFFIIKDILNYILYELKLKTHIMIKYASIILHSYCSYYFNEHFFITTPKLNMKSIFLNYMKHNTIKILDNINFLQSSSFNNTNVKLFINDDLKTSDDRTKLYDNIIKLRKSCQFSRLSSYNGEMLFNVIKFKQDWIKLIKTYLTTNHLLKGGLNINKYKKKQKTKKQIIKKYKIKYNKSTKNINNI